jgi:hypothetical protein
MSVVISNSVCAPSSADPATSKGTCLPYATLVLIAHLYNAAHPNAKPIPIKGTRRGMSAAIDARFSGCASMDETCWVKQPFIAKSSQIQRVTDDAFKPPMPNTWKQNKNAWLSNEDIAKVLSQYEDADPKFKYVGTFPIDFGHKNVTKPGHCIADEVCKLNLRKERAKGVVRFGFVFNTDPHTKGGQHWIAAYVGIDPKDKNYGVFYYDSVAKATPTQIEHFMSRIKRMASDLGLGGIGKDSSGSRPFRVMRNDVRRQFKGTECGIFVILFIIQMRSVPFARVCRTMGTDDEVEKFRSVLFRTEKTEVRQSENVAKKNGR